MKRILIIALVSIVHLGLVVGLVLATLEMSGFLFGVYPSPNQGLLHRLLTAIHDVLIFPPGQLTDSLNSSLQFLAWPIMLLNSLLWAVAIYLAAVWLISLKSPKLTH